MARGRVYTAAQKQDTLRVYRQHGLAAAHKATSVPKPTIVRWATLAGMTQADRDQVTANVMSGQQKAAAASVAARQEKIEARRGQLTETLSGIAMLSTQTQFRVLQANLAYLTGQGLPEGMTAEALERALDTMRDVVGAGTRAIHDLNVLSGDPTEITKDVTQMSSEDKLAELHDLTAKIKARAERAAG